MVLMKIAIKGSSGAKNLMPSNGEMLYVGSACRRYHLIVYI